MIRLYFKCKFLSDIILNAQTATEGNQKTLDYIPGSNFLGITASSLYKKESEITYEIFHSSRVRFGNAYPWDEKERAIPVPFCFYLPKGKQITDPESDVYLIHAIPESYYSNNIIADGIQLKQVRNGYLFTGKSLFFKPENAFKIKSAQDRLKRKSKDAQMYGYESLSKDLEWQFFVDMDSDEYKESIIEALVGIKKLGRSKTAEYGLVEITFQRQDSIPSTLEVSIQDDFVIYAESDLCFLDKYGQPTITPTAQDFGLSEEYKIRFDKSQIRSRMYAPYNFKRKTRECDRLVILKGSVFIIEGEKHGSLKLPNKPVGLFRNEGFGQCIFNPHFIQADPLTGKLRVNIREQEEKIKTEPIYSVIEKGDSDSIVFNWLKEQHSKIHLDTFRHNVIDDFMKNHRFRYAGISKSQWGEIRSKADMTNCPDELIRILFNKDTGYILHGQRSKEWSVNNAHDTLHNEICDLRKHPIIIENPNLLCQIIKLLAIEMQK